MSASSRKGSTGLDVSPLDFLKDECWERSLPGSCFRHVRMAFTEDTQLELVELGIKPDFTV